LPHKLICELQRRIPHLSITMSIPTWQNWILWYIKLTGFQVNFSNWALSSITVIAVRKQNQKLQTDSLISVNVRCHVSVNKWSTSGSWIYNIKRDR
jgi:hypothetical protein